MTGKCKWSLRLLLGGCLLMTSTFCAMAQEKILVFRNIFDGKTVVLKAGDRIRLRFTVQDTMNAPFDVAVNDITVEGTIESITNKSVNLSARNKYFDRASLTVPNNGIESFRKYKALRPIMKAGTTVLASAVAMLATLQISESGEVLSWQNAGLAIAAGSAVLFSREIFSDRMKYYAVEGWRPEVMIAPHRH